MELTKHLREHYKPLSTIHKSTTNEILQVEGALTKELFALKIIKRGKLLYSEIAAIRHPNLPKIFLVEETDSATYVVEEYLRGQNLQDYLDEHGAFNEHAVARIAVELCNCLEVLHARHIIHRDIKPANLFLTTAGELKLIDFDVARLEKPGSVADTNLIGTPGFAAPEQYGFHQTDERTDIYALGLTLRMLAGYENYHGFLTAVFDKCTEFDPRKRYDSVKNLRRAIILRRHLHSGKKYFAATIAGIFFMQSGMLNEGSEFVESPPKVVAPVEQENPPPTYVEPIADEDFYQPDSDISPPIYDEPIVEESSPPPDYVEPPADNPLEEIIADTAQVVEEKDLEPPPQMSRSDFANQMRNLNLSDEELDAKQDEYRQRLEMNQRIREFKAELPDDMDADDRREAIRIYTLQEREKIKK